MALACAAFVAATSASISDWLFRPSPKASAQKARNCPPVVAVPAGVDSAGREANRLARYQKIAASAPSLSGFPSSMRTRPD
jgi:hypothetical protein